MFYFGVDGHSDNPAVPVLTGTVFTALGCTILFYSVVVVLAMHRRRLEADSRKRSDASLQVGSVARNHFR